VAERVYEVADTRHEGQRRASGESYIEHPLAVADILADLEMDRATIAAALLHDVVEDTVVTSEEVAERVRARDRALVDGVTKLTRIPYQSKEDAQVENLRKMFLAMAKDIRVIIIKLADRLHNMRTLASLPPAKQQTIARETIEIYAPIAHRLGIWRSSGISRICACATSIPRPTATSPNASPRSGPSAKPPSRTSSPLQVGQFDKVGDHAEVTGRPKHFYSIHKKMKKGRDFSTIYDLTAVRVIVDSVKDCYGALGVVHSMWKPLPGASKTTSRCPSPTCTSRCTRRSSGRAAIRSRCRSARSRCTARASTASPRTGAIKKAAARPTTSSRS
jgi:guanosine-3',5'-bis(diphosphate) 3'-pyrophosphohydrolase